MLAPFLAPPVVAPGRPGPAPPEADAVACGRTQVAPQDEGLRERMAGGMVPPGRVVAYDGLQGVGSVEQPHRNPLQAGCSVCPSPASANYSFDTRWTTV